MLVYKAYFSQKISDNLSIRENIFVIVPY